ncbi:MAG: hypothetical protein KBE16_03385 [Alphaproteobacteria bacterium]|jgi:hypothetical protein|nr:hypothetical protein [Alphaproteobacteria bacterium]MBP9877991.1 hypothetical protein [Alphaproteobacteria bacterium]
MASYYLVERIEEAFELSQGNALRARRLIEEWSRTDHRLLHELVEPYLASIIGKHIQPFASTATKPLSASKKAAKPKKLTDDQLSLLLQRLDSPIQAEAGSKEIDVSKSAKKIKPMEWGAYKKIGPNRTSHSDPKKG